MSEKTITQAIRDYIEMIEGARSENTARAYTTAMEAFVTVLLDNDIEPHDAPVAELNEKPMAWLASYLKMYAPSTEQLYMIAVSGFYQYLAAEQLAPINLPRVELLVKQRGRRQGQRIPQFPKDNIEQVIEYAERLNTIRTEDARERLRNLRDRALILVLADTGLRIHEACQLRRGDVDWNSGRAVIVGKGDKEAPIRFSNRALAAMREYLDERQPLDGQTGRPLGTLPVFARHDKGAGKRVKQMTTRTGHNAVTDRVRECLGESAAGTITPHSFRHYFVTRVLQESGNLKLAQELARHANIQMTQRYAHLADSEIDSAYDKIFN